jgi:hypothetical protein
MAEDVKIGEEVRLSDLESDLGQAQELPPQDRARLTLALSLLSAMAIIFLLSGAALIYGPASRLEQAKEVFDFVKTFTPPIVTLVIGFYFRGEN